MAMLALRGTAAVFRAMLRRPTVSPDSRSGTVKVLQSGIWSNAVNFDVDTDVSPNNSPPGTVVTLTGSGFGALQGSGTVQLGSIAGIVQDWNEIQITATVAAGSVSGIARVQQNGILSNAVAFTVPVSSGAVTMAPNLINMVVGDTRTMQALDASSRPITGLNWISSDPAVYSVVAAVPISSVSTTFFPRRGERDGSGWQTSCLASPMA
jgi:hypothetical protein